MTDLRTVDGVPQGDTLKSRMPALTPSGTSCPFCNCSDIRAFTASAHDAPGRAVSIVECRPCEAAWQWPLARNKEISVAYFSESYQAAETGGYFDGRRREEVARMELAYVESVAPRGSILDIGCGAGEFVVRAAASGWTATGVDPALPTPMSLGPTRLIRGSFEELGDEKFDVVTLWDVIEHVDDPVSLLVAAHNHIRPGGTLIIETGNYQSAGRIESGRKWWDYQLDHRWYFSPPVLFRLLEDCGFPTARHHNRVLRPWWEGEAKYDGPSSIAHLKAAVRKPHKAAEIITRYRSLKRASKWLEWSGLEIVTISARAA